MGLDMYLKAKGYYSSAEYRGEENNKKFEELKELGDLGDYLDEYLPSISLEASVGYWRTQTKSARHAKARTGWQRWHPGVSQQP